MIDFPASPTVGQRFTAVGVTWTWDGVKWGLTAAAGAPITIGNAPPSSPVIGALWFDTNGGQMYVWYNDGTSSQWVPVVNQGSSSSSSSSSSSGPTIVLPPTAASWTQKGFVAGISFVDVPNGLLFTDANSNGGTYRLTGVSMVAPTPPYTIDARIRASLVMGNPSSAGIGWTDGTKFQGVMGGMTSTAAPFSGMCFRTSAFSGFTTVAFVSDQLLQNYTVPNPYWLRIRDDNAGNIYFYFSVDGVNFTQTYTAAKSAGYLGATGYTNVVFNLISGLSQLPPGSSAVLDSWWVH